ncbi:glycosyltransferase family 4 protein [Kineosporia succinea]|uniref:Phosphatidylinositol alpha 1,6-mannosyltransferase n=1 Tax=Kineosporia succinea TaxID=84632 RepID=A0ABT9P3S6_9ACTN|nr:glycosyltransferase family 1 protein [Kineosporia succinea]MDP9827332.1 phosphatidylinositol alpha 1,6-mannosyltransferase [Kineosporia succinea]
MQRESVVGAGSELALVRQDPAGTVSPILPASAPRSGKLRVAIVAESFLPTGNGVTNSVCRVLDHLASQGHEAVVICPGPAPASFAGFPVVGVPSFSYRQFPVGMPSSKVLRTLSGFRPDIVHLASPFVLGAVGVTAAGQLGVPTVAVFQTDVPAFAARHHLGVLASTAWRWVRRIHSQADLTLAPSSAAMRELRAHAVPRLALWQRGVDSDRFHPDRRATPAVRELTAELAPNGEVLVGYVGRLATEKRVQRLAALGGLPNVRLVIVGDGPHRRTLERTLRNATFLGWRDGDDLADAFAALDLFVHTGTSETFGQTLQEAMASGVPVIAPAAGGPLDLVTPGTNGLLYAPEDDDDLRRCVQSLADDPEQRRWMGAAGRVGVQRNTWDLLGEELVAHYRGVLSTRAVVAS